MQKNDAIKVIINCAKDYSKNLAEKNLLFVFGDKLGPSRLECYFDANNYLHLTGIIYDGSPANFYSQCLDNRLAPSSFDVKTDGTTEMKLRALPKLVQIHKEARMIGNYNHSKPLLTTEKLVGNIHACLGFIQKDRFYIPNTALWQDIRDISMDRKRVLAVFRKEKRDAQYYELCYKTKGIDIATIQSLNADKVLLEKKDITIDGSNSNTQKVTIFQAGKFNESA